MTDEEWEAQRKRAIMAAFQTGRSVFANNDGELRYVDGDGERLERLADEVGVAQEPIPQAKAHATWWERLRRWLVGRP